ncbi:MAG: thermonuclease family protein [Pirellulales bacterium]|nr:thermonuclease family protein [Pirellulales bacterium]
MDPCTEKATSFAAPRGRREAERSLRRYWQDRRGWLVWLVGLVIVIWRTYVSYTQQPASGPDVLVEGMHEVRRVVDGDTLLLANNARVRLQGINAPESVKPDSPVEQWGPEASAFAKAFFERANYRVRLTFSEERQDRYDRYLAFVWHNETMLNEELVRAGLAYARLDYPYSSAMKRRLAAAQEEARQAKRGIWSKGK